MWASDPSGLKLSSDKHTDWMTQPYRLAQAMRRVCDVLYPDRIYEGTSAYLDDEQILLEVNENECYTREVFLGSADTRFCFARTVVPQKTFAAYEQAFLSLQGRLLGDTLLYVPGAQTSRSDFQYNVITAEHSYFEKCEVDPLQRLGARRSIFYIDNQYPLLLTEIFLPDIPLYQPEVTVENPQKDTSNFPLEASC